MKKYFLPTWVLVAAYYLNVAYALYDDITNNHTGFLMDIAVVIAIHLLIIERRIRNQNDERSVATDQQSENRTPTP